MDVPCYCVTLEMTGKSINVFKRVSFEYPLNLPVWLHFECKDIKAWQRFYFFLV